LLNKGANLALVFIQEISYNSHGETADASITDTPPRPSAASNGHPSTSQEQMTDAEVPHSGFIEAVSPVTAPCGTSCVYKCGNKNRKYGHRVL
jgi:hypothetical protein